MAKSSDVRRQVSDEEWQVRVDLAACYRVIAMYGWDDLVFTHISARVPGPDEHFLINPYGCLFEEITASSLVKVNLAGDIVLATDKVVNPAGFVIHSAIHAARHDVMCVLHTHTKAGVAVSAQAHGLLPISQVALFPYATLAYHNYEGVALNDEEKPRLVADLGSKNALILRNHGLLTTGASIADAFLMMYVLETACQTQVLAQSGGSELIQVAPQIVAGIQAQAEKVTRGLGGSLVWPGLLRKLDRRDPSFRD
ncbi:MAG: class II aldolase/adducin family protein [Gammaproteobacteria bacterium]|nr:class II aldolase/adducin family protein [Gammaproteobacteria bacterium]MDH5303199.1 class II aldolase/adducin family protein [Gammaproteobacteria bacterium]MDH5320793.1 class II aldolase/adducin family protein [Gammaproteobacteria bacterium]